MHLARSPERRSRAALSRRGAASVEAVVALPVLIVLLLGVAFVARLDQARAAALRAARRCVFEYAVAGCDHVPASCREAPRDARVAAGAGRSAQIIATSRAGRRGGFDVFDDIPVVGSALSSLFGSDARAIEPYEVAAAVGRTRVRGTVAIELACNERPHSVLADVEQVFCRYLPVIHCKGPR